MCVFLACKIRVGREPDPSWELTSRLLAWVKSNKQVLELLISCLQNSSKWYSEVGFSVCCCLLVLLAIYAYTNKYCHLWYIAYKPDMPVAEIRPLVTRCAGGGNSPPSNKMCRSWSKEFNYFAFQKMQPSLVLSLCYRRYYTFWVLVCKWLNWSTSSSTRYL